MGQRLAEANHAPPPDPIPAPTPAAPALDPAYAAGTVEIAAKMGITAAELRRRYQEGAEVCKTTPEAFWGEHVRSMRNFTPEDALEMNVQYCRMRQP